MDLKGAEVRNFYKLSSDVGVNDETVGVIKIPHYQRPYKWDKNLVGQLIEDWNLENKKNKGGEYFAGSIVTVSNGSSVDSIHQLIDGQQRFTTIYLTNFLLFLLLRSTLREAVIGKQQIAIEGLLEKLKTSIKFSVTKEVNEILSIEDLEDAFDELSSSGLEEVIDKYHSNIHLPSEPESHDNYDEIYISNLGKFINSYIPRLSYDRDSYNKSLCSALSMIEVTCSSQDPLKVKINRISLPNPECIENVYLDAIEQIFESFEKIGKEKSAHKKQNAFKISLSIIDSMVSFLEGVKLCVIQTGNSEDAYTLFEVLNDRALALDDLDLVKNQFYRYLCISSKNTHINDDDIDKEIVIREEQWGDKVFKNNTDTNQKLIAYLATSYITGSKKIGLKSHDKFRDEIKKYLDEYEEKYSFNDLKQDFNVFECVRVFLDKFETKARGRVNKALEAEFSSKTITYKTVHLLLALGYEGVLAGMVNLILQYMRIYISDDFDPVKVLAAFEELASDSTKHVEIHEQAKIIWQLALLSPDYKAPKELANKIIEDNNKSVKSTNSLRSQAANLPKDELLGWLSPWRYSSNEVRVKILFARLLQLELENGKLKRTTFSLNLKPDDILKLHLDHMEPSNPEGSTPTAYYKCGQIDRDDDVNALGNMFPLPGSENINKSNKPMYTVFDFLNNAGLKNHWLTVETKSQFDNNCLNKVDVDVPTQQFFTVRKTYLIDMFYSAIML